MRVLRVTFESVNPDKPEQHELAWHLMLPLYRGNVDANIASAMVELQARWFFESIVLMGAFDEEKEK